MHLRQVSANPVGYFIDSVLRGIGQVMLQNNPVTGLLFLLGIFVGSWVAGLYALLGTVVATGSAQLFGAPQDHVRQGLFGFNGTLTGLGLALYLRHDPILVVYVIVAALSVTIVTAAIQDVLGAQGHTLTGPFVLVTWIFIAGLFAYSRLHGAPALGAPHLPTDTVSGAAVLTPVDAAVGLLNGVAEVTLQQSVWTGAIFLVALAVNSRISCAAAVLGSAIGIGVGWSLGAAPAAIQDGLYGFNAVLTAIALGGLFFLLHRITVLLAILAVIVSTILYGSLAAILSPLGLPALTAPFVITTWLCLLATASLARLQALSPAEPTTPEGNLQTVRAMMAKKR